MPDQLVPFPPGSSEAVKRGCKCPVMDNNHGRGSGYFNQEGDPVFWYNLDCPIHGEAKPIKDDAILSKKMELINNDKKEKTPE